MSMTEQALAREREVRQLTTRYLVGLDLGQAQDPTALLIAERFLKPVGLEQYVPQYRFKHIERFPLGTLYTVVGDAVKQVCSTPPVAGNLVLLVDATGVGRGVLDLIDERLGRIAHAVRITITGGDQETRDPAGNGWHVPKKNLVAAVQRLLQMESFKAGKELPEGETFTKELGNFRIKVTLKGNETYEAWREQDHDDTVLAAAMIAWYGERFEAKAPPRPVEQPAWSWQGVLNSKT